MARPLRIQFAGAWYHLMNRGAGRRIIFPDDLHRHCFLDLLGEIHARYGVEIHAWCFMGNHYHLLARTPLPNLARAMRHLDGVYTQRHNRMSKTDGALFRGRYKAIVVDEDGYLAKLSRYIHRNPVEANLTARPETWHWSSYRAYIGRANVAEWLYTENTLALFGTQQQRRRYRDYVELGVDDEISQFYRTDRLRPVLGSPRFRDGLQRFIEDSDAVEIPDRRWLRKNPDLETIIEATAVAFDFIPEALIRGSQGRPNVPRAVAMGFCRSPGGYSLKAIARAFGLRSYTSVSMAIHRLQPKLEDPSLRRIVEPLKRRLFGFV